MLFINTNHAGIGRFPSTGHDSVAGFIEDFAAGAKAVWSFLACFLFIFFAGAWFSTCDEMVSLKLVGDGRQGFGEEVSSVGEKRGALVQWRVPLTGSVSYRPPLHGLASPTDGAEGQRLRRVFIV